MTQYICANDYLSSNFVDLSYKKSLLSEDESETKTQFDSLIKEFSSESDEKTTNEEKNDSEDISEILRKAGSKYSMCNNCGAIFKGDVFICTNCGNKIAEQTTNNVSSVK